MRSGHVPDRIQRELRPVLSAEVRERLRAEGISV
jgi:hypothetical protein